MKKIYKWGIMAPGRMAVKFANGLKLAGNAELYAVASRNPERAAKFAKDLGFRKYYGSYDQLVNDPEVDIIYIASPHSAHREQTLLCLRNNKAVLCEKAFALNSREAEEMIDEAVKRKVFLMEALWPPFQPYYKKGKEIIETGNLGRIHHLNGYFSFIPPFDPADRKFDVNLGGGSLLDIGIYPVIDVLTYMGVPDEVKAFASFGPTGSEESITAIFSFIDGRLASIYSSFKTNVGIGCDISCDKGNLTLSRGRDMNQRVIMGLHGKEKETFVFSPPGLGYHWEADHVMKCLDEGLTESPFVPLSFSLDLMKTLDRIRKAAGIVFPADRAD